MIYTERLEAALTMRSELAAEITFLRLQIKQERQQAKWAKGSQAVKDVLAVYPMAQIENGAGMSYITVKLACSDMLLCPGGWSLHEQREVDPSKLNSPVLTTYRNHGVPALIYVVKQVY
jgi:hypothetical protein